ncbi:MAG: polysaccharide deacetylase family protein [Bacteroidia bacterium]|nr:polysaccharide deacetylase family protein [Bacteroidia bacterium]
MSTSPALQILGFPPGTRLLIIHADDAGLCHSVNQAVMQAFQAGGINSCSLMAPCPGFEEMAGLARQNPQYDYGLHLTLTSEWTRFKWGPVSPVGQVKSLVDEAGFLHPTSEAVRVRSQPAEVENELRAQLQKAIDYGLNPSHLDTHMFSMGLSYELLEIYQRIGREFRIPVMQARKTIEYAQLDAKACFGAGDLVVDEVLIGLQIHRDNGGLEAWYSSALANLKPGLNVMLLHPGFDDPELQEITRGHPNYGAAWRETDLRFALSEACRAAQSRPEIRMITWREIQNRLYPD